MLLVLVFAIVFPSLLLLYVQVSDRRTLSRNSYRGDESFIGTSRIPSFCPKQFLGPISTRQ